MVKKFYLMIMAVVIVLLCVACSDEGIQRTDRMHLRVNIAEERCKSTVAMPTAESMITRTYSTEEIESLCNLIESRAFEFQYNRLTIEEFRTMYEVECLRETHQGSYVVLLRDDGKKVFVFFDEKGYSYRYGERSSGIMIVDEFLTKSELYSTIADQPKHSDILTLDPYALEGTNTGMFFTLHIIQEGGVVLRYPYTGLTDDPIVDTEWVDYIDNEEIPTYGEGAIQDYVVYIYPVDKR